MTTIYIDVYFLINFTVDLLAFHFASLFSRVYVKSLRLVCASGVSALLACAMVFINTSPILTGMISVASFIIVSYVLVAKVGIVRRIKLMVAFLLFLTIIGGLVYFAFNLIDSYFPKQAIASLNNRRLLILSMVVLLSIGIIRMMLSMFFHSKTEKTVRLRLELLGRTIECDALVDSGNLLKDPIDLTPVMLIKAESVKGLFPNGVPEPYSVNDELNRFIRLIPVSKNGSVTLESGIRPQRAWIIRKRQHVETKLTFIIDREEGSFGGYGALVPASALERI